MCGKCKIQKGVTHQRADFFAVLQKNHRLTDGITYETTFDTACCSSSRKKLGKTAITLLLQASRSKELLAGGFLK
jgi:hypothetical protein